jgi:hypothetical protein
MPHKFVVVGKGTSGAITATYLKAYWGENVDVTCVFDSKIKTIGVGESLTPSIYNYLNYIGISREEMIKKVNATVKIGLKFQNWTGDGSGFYHTFSQLLTTDSFIDHHNFVGGYDIATNRYDNQLLYGKFLLDGNRIPKTQDVPQSLHFDATLLSEYVLEKFKDKLNLIDAKVVDVVLKENDFIDHLQLEDGRKVYGDFFIDATGFASLLFKKLNRTWIDKTDWMPLDRCIPNPTSYTHPGFINPYTTAEASSDGWILQVPLQERWGTGFLYSSEFTTDEQAFERFDSFLKQRYSQSLTNTSRVINFKSGYWSEQWIGNCLAVGLSSGFAEPLEATNIHQTIDQIQLFLYIYNFKVFDFDRKEYNDFNTRFYNRIYDYIRFCYTGGRSDSVFWEYMNANVPQRVKDIEEKIYRDITNDWNWIHGIFSYQNFTCVAHGLNKIDRESYMKEIFARNVLKVAKEKSDYFIASKHRLNQDSYDHYLYIKNVIS